MAQGRKTGGRVAGTPNRATHEIREQLARAAGKAGYAKRLHQLTQSEDEHVAVKAISLALAYLYGRPPERIEVAGDDTRPVLVKFVGVD